MHGLHHLAGFSSHMQQCPKVDTAARDVKPSPEVPVSLQLDRRSKQGKRRDVLVTGTVISECCQIISSLWIQLA